MMSQMLSSDFFDSPPVLKGGSAQSSVHGIFTSNRLLRSKARRPFQCLGDVRRRARLREVSGRPFPDMSSGGAGETSAKISLRLGRAAWSAGRRRTLPLRPPGLPPRRKAARLRASAISARCGTRRSSRRAPRSRWEAYLHLLVPLTLLLPRGKIRSSWTATRPPGRGSRLLLPIAVWRL